ncbi:MAG: hypothetical protein ACK5RG_00580 [Cyclobacteriaceae bacterium]|jgi:acyl-CoA thioesterase-1
MHSAKRILCVGDSLGLPRNEVKFEKTWFYLVKYSFPEHEFIAQFTRGITTKSLCGDNSNDYLEFYSPQILILQIGIVDCAPRYFKSNSIILKLVSILPGYFKRMTWALIKKFVKRTPNNADVTSFEFKENLTSYLLRAETMKLNRVIIIKIGNPGEAMLRQNPLIRDQVINYNKVLNDISLSFRFVQLIDPLNEGASGLYLADGYHLSEVGHSKVFDEISKTLEY